MMNDRQIIHHLDTRLKVFIRKQVGLSGYLVDDLLFALAGIGVEVFFGGVFFLGGLSGFSRETGGL